MDAHDETIRDEFTRQSASFNAAPAMRAGETLGALIDFIGARRGERWLESACGPGIVSRALAPQVTEVKGVDLTPAMVELAATEAAAAGIANATFAVGDATALDEPDESFDGAVTRFSLHHIPRPERVIAELARVVRADGAVVIADAIADDDPGAAAWREEIERLRDPSHWAFVGHRRLLRAGEAAGLELERESLSEFGVDFEGWLDRGSTGRERSALIETALEDLPASATTTHVSAVNGRRQLVFSYSLSLWRAR